MKGRSIGRGFFWSLVALLLIANVAGGWHYSNDLINRAFVPDGEPVVAPSGDYDLRVVHYDSPLGPMEAWHLPASGDTWVLHVHGLGGTPADTEFMFAALQDAGYPQLSITYRNDHGAPEDPSGYYQYGATEHQDVLAAFTWIKDNGADAVILSGISTGGSHLLSFVLKNNLDEVRGLILDSPNIDMGDTVDFAASQEPLPILPGNVPPPMTWTAKFLTSLRIGVNWQSIDHVEKSENSLRVPVLVHHGEEDTTVPISQSVDFAERNADLVKLVRVSGAGHVGSYQTSPDSYLAEVLAFLEWRGQSS